MFTVLVYEKTQIFKGFLLFLESKEHKKVITKLGSVILSKIPLYSYLFCCDGRIIIKGEYVKT
jgi:hypothetical protein